MLKTLIEDTQHWQNLPPPLFPNETEVDIFKDNIAGLCPVYLLGMTRELAPLCDVAVDLMPTNIGKITLQSDWNHLTGIHAGAIIGDGVLNLAGLELVDKMLAISPRFICRVFLKKFPSMKYAMHFPTELPGTSLVIPTQKDVVIAVWNTHGAVR